MKKLYELKLDLKNNMNPIHVFFIDDEYRIEFNDIILFLL